jgi:hypothetical protein
MKRVLPDIYPDYADRLPCCRKHGVLLVWVPLASLALEGQEHGRTIPLPDMRQKLRRSAYNVLASHLPFTPDKFWPRSERPARAIFLHWSGQSFWQLTPIANGKITERTN